jgi:hypothetical protein
MTTKEKGRLRGDPIPNDCVRQDNSESTLINREFASALARSVLGRNYIVVHEPIGARFRTRAPSRIRAWRVPA